jgi:hypothetical protein
MRWFTRLPKWLKWLLGLSAAGAFACAAMIVALVVYLDNTLCGYDLKSSAVSPDGRYKAAVVEVNCGATTSYVSWAVLTKANKKFNYRKDHLASVETQAMTVRWEGQKLVVRWPAGLDANKAKKQPAFVEYRPLPN